MLGFFVIVTPVVLILAVVAIAKARARQNRVRLLRHQLGGDKQVEIVGGRGGSSDRIGIATVPPLRSASLFADDGGWTLSAAGPREPVAVDDDALLAGGDADLVAALATAFLEGGGDVRMSSDAGAVHARISGWNGDGHAMKARLLSFTALVDAVAERSARAPVVAVLSSSSSSSSSSSPVRETAGAPSGVPMGVPR